MPLKSGWDAIIVDPDSRDFCEDTIIYHDHNHIINRHVMPYLRDIEGVRRINNRAEPFDCRLGTAPEMANFSSAIHGGPATPAIEVTVGTPTRLHAVGGVCQ